MRAEFYNNDGTPFMVQGRHATVTIAEAQDYLYIPCVKKSGEHVLYKFMRLAVSDDNQVVLYALMKTRHLEGGSS